MKILPSLFALIAAALLLTGCESSGVSARIQEKSTVYAALNPEQQRMIKDGEIEVGFTADMVYLSLGKASKSEVKDTPDGPITILTFEKYYPTNTTIRMINSDNGGMTYAPPMLGGNAPGSNPGAGPRVMPGVSANTGSVGQPLQSLEPADLPVHTLYVFLYKGRVYEIQLSQ